MNCYEKITFLKQIKGMRYAEGVKQVNVNDKDGKVFFFSSLRLIIKAEGCRCVRVGAVAGYSVTLSAVVRKDHARYIIMDQGAVELLFFFFI